MVGKNLLVLLAIGLLSFTGNTQITEGKIIFERKTNLMKRMGDNPRMKDFITEENKYRIENFEFYFKDSLCLFKPLPTD